MLAAAYLRSSKDRSDVSISAQFRALEQLAEQRGLKIVRRYEDAVESGATEDRPGFAELLRAIRNPRRGWDHLLLYDTSRLARRRHISIMFEEVECRKHGVRVVYKSVPEADPVTEMLLKSILQAMDEWHSMTSKQKGLAGMAENVRQGWRAGGRAPMGYRLERHSTGAVREGRPVMKSRLALGDQATVVGYYLAARAAGVPRSQARGSLEYSDSTLICMEWNALVYAGHTVWNVHAPAGSGRKRRPRSEWMIQRDTHPALITEAQAEALIGQLESSPLGMAVSRGKQAVGRALLAGKLVTADGQPWVAHGGHYRLRKAGGGKLVRAAVIERAVTEQLRADCESDTYLAQLVAAVKQQYRAGPGHDLEGRIRKLEREKARAAELALVDPAFVDLVAERGRQVEALRRELEAHRQDDRLGDVVRELTVGGLRELLADQDPATRIQLLVESVTLNPDLTCQMVYKAAPGAMWRSLASPRGFGGSPHPALVRPLKLAA
jgi:DNA invertase Pin-like site-specific DNA recombinase